MEAAVLPRLGAALASMDDPTVLVLDDVHVIDNPRCIDALVALAGHVHGGSQLALSARDRSALPMGLLRTRGLIKEVGTADLRMGERDARQLLRAAGLELVDADVTELVRRTEGWPAGLYLAALTTGPESRQRCRQVDRGRGVPPHRKRAASATYTSVMTAAPEVAASSIRDNSQ